MEPIIVSQTLEYSDGTKKVIEINPNPNAEAIETTYSEAIAETSPELLETESTVTGGEPLSFEGAKETQGTDAE